MTPAGWTSIRLGDLFSKRAERGREGLPTLSVTINDGLVSRDSLDRKMDTTLGAEEHLLVRRGDIAYNMMRMWQGASGLATADALVSPAYVVLRPNPEIDPQFAAYLFKHPRTIYLFWAYSYGLTEDRLRLYFDDFSLIPITLPPLSEQRRIAEILLTWDRAIETVEALVANARAQKAALMQLLLTGKRRLPGFGGALQGPPEEQREWDVIPEGWRCATIGTIGQVITGSTPPTDDQTYYGGDIPFVAPGDLGHSKYVHQSEKTITDRGLAVCRPLPKGATLFTCIGSTIGKLGLAARPLATNQQINAVVPSSDNDAEFVYYQLACVAKRIAQMAGSHAVPMISKSQFAAERILLPVLPEQRRVAEILSSRDRAIDAYSTQLAALRQEKAALMQQLLTGKRRAKLAEASAA